MMKKLKQFVEKHSKRLNHRGENNPNFKGGVRRLGKYYWVQQKHSRAVKFGDTPYVMRAVTNLEKKIGRKLTKGELPHHKNSNKLDDSLRNLEVQTQAGHRRLHSIGKSNIERQRVKRVSDLKAQETIKRDDNED